MYIQYCISINTDPVFLFLLFLGVRKRWLLWRRAAGTGHTVNTGHTLWWHVTRHTTWLYEYTNIYTIIHNDTL